MKKTLIIAIATIGTFCVRAQSGPTVVTNSTNLNQLNAPYSNYDYVGKFGVGVIFGEPTGASLKYWLNDRMAVDGAIGWSTRDDTQLYLHADVLWHNFELIPVSQGRMPVYFGVGGLLRFRDHNHDDEAGIRVPIGVSYMFDRAPVDIFAEIAPTLDIAPDARGEVTGGIGVRFWF